MLHRASLGLGLAALGRPGYMTLGHADDVADVSVEGMRRQAHLMLDRAWALGVRHIDTARSYGEGEAFLAQWLARRTPADITISSKWGYAYTAEWRTDAPVHEVKEHSVAQLWRQWPQTQTLLGRWLSLYQVHSATLTSGFLADDVTNALARLKATQGIRLGLSVTGEAQAQTIRAALQVQRDGLRLFDSVQATWNPLEPSAGPALQEAKDRGVHVIVKEALANGRLSSRGARTALHDEAARRHVAVEALALACALEQPFADVVLTGAATLSQLEISAQATTVRAGLVAAVAEPSLQYWATRSRLPWG